LRAPVGAGPFGRDFEAYYAAGVTAARGGDPWSRDIWRAERAIPGVDARRDELLPYAGPAAALPLWELFARLPFALARDAWLAVLALALAVLACASLALAGIALTAFDAGTAVLFAALCGPSISAITLGQAALLSAAALALALVALRRSGAWAGAAAFVAAFQPNLALPLAALLTERRAAIALVSAGAAFLGASLALGGGPAGFAAYVQRLAEHGAAERFIAIQVGIPAIAASFGAPAGLANGLAAGCALIAFAAASVAAWRLRARPPLGVLVAAGLLPLIVAFFHEHDFTLDIIAAIVLAASPQPRVRALTGVASAFALVDWFGLAQRPAGTLQTAVLALALGCAYAALPNPAGGRAGALALGACAALLALALPLAHAYPAPVWPDTLGAYHAAANLDAAAVWAAEQQRSGLLAAVPAWGLLRALPLTGGVLFAWAALLAAGEERFQVRGGPAMTIRPLRIASGTASSDSPSQGPSTQ
jgi:hypothetical protein